MKVRGFLLGKLELVGQPYDRMGIGMTLAPLILLYTVVEKNNLKKIYNFFVYIKTYIIFVNHSY
jgi:hypothetical protein